jgi:cell wall-associated NlpC family hydrolase
MPQPGRHTGLMGRGRLLSIVAAVALLAVGWFAIGASGKDGASTPAATAAKSDSLPPLPTMRPKVVEPVAGDAADSGDAAGEDPGLEDVGPAPSAPASKAARPTGGLAGDSASVTRATALPNGIAVPPLEGPDAVKQMIEAGNIIARTPYVWGGGHGKWIDKGYDCSGSVSFVLAAAGLLNGPLDSGRLSHWGEAGPGRWVTIYANSGHVFMEVAGIRFDTSGARVTGSRWQNAGRSTAGFAVRHPAGL